MSNYTNCPRNFKSRCQRVLELELEALVDESRALAIYIARHGDVLEEEKEELYEALLKAIEQVSDKSSANRWSELMSAYAKITAVTFRERGVNGRTILDAKDAGDISWCHCNSPKNRPILIGGVIFICTLILELLVSWSGSVSDMAALNSWQRFFFFNITTLSNLLFPALWGGLGACIFLAKRLSDKRFELAYEESRTHL